MNNYSLKEKINYLKQPYNCQGFFIDDYVEYYKDGQKHRGYINCFRQFGYNWFAWICPDLDASIPLTSVYVGDLTKIEE